MVQSQNTKVDHVTKGNSFLGMPTYGKIMIGDKAFEYYNDRDPNDYIQIPWTEIDHITASVIFNKWISRFMIHTKKSGNYKFSAKNNRKTLAVVRNYIPPERMLRSLSFFEVIGRGLKALIPWKRKEKK